MQKPKKSMKMPEEGEFLMGTVSKVFPYGAFVKLDDYAGVEGMIHVSEISAKWVKNIRDHVKESETIVVKVLRVDASKGHVDLSLKSVKANQKKMIVEQRKQDQKAKKLVELAGKNLKKEGETEDIVKKLEKNFRSAYDALEQIKKDGKDVLKGAEIDEKWMKELGKIADEHVTIPKVGIKVVMKLNAPGPDGVDTIKSALAKAKEQVTGEVEAVFKYVGAPKYKVELTGLDYKTLETCLENITKVVTAEMTGKSGTVEIERQK
jgi:translation initiation factor 2 subunit 1|tara:strand:- start:1463 stop:2254 length:792 start_codon:yes stop_codon:yes gene_type:complete